ncbi:hypothetical protein QUA82_20910 [Microcoleus sp. F8-D3]
MTKPLSKGVSAVNSISVEELKALVQQSPGLWVSIYMPVAQGTEIQQNPIRFKNLIREAEEKIVKYGFDKKRSSPIARARLIYHV